MQLRRVPWPAFLIAVLVMGLSAVLLVEGRMRDVDLARLGSLETANRVIEAFAEGEEPEIAEAAVIGWGVYTPEGTAVTRSGTAPAMISESDKERLTTEILDNQRLLTVRTMVAPGVFGGHRGSGGSGGGQRRQILVDWDLGSGNPAELRRILSAGGLIILSILMLILQQRSAQKLAIFREEEERKKRLVQLGMAARTLTHEIRNPLGSIRMQSALLGKTFGDQGREELAIIEEEVDRLNALTERVRDWLSDPVGSPTVFDAVKETRRIAARLPWKTHCSFEDQEIPVKMDLNLFGAALTNVIRNAHESSTASSDPPLPEIRIVRESKTVQLIVEDRGNGLPDGEMSRLFDPFFTTKESGSGIGLALAKQAVEAAGGTLTLKNRPGGGARAAITLAVENQ